MSKRQPIAKKDDFKTKLKNFKFQYWFCNKLEKESELTGVPMTQIVVNTMSKAHGWVKPRKEE